jgi:uncharacterized protein YjbJ (UPF0337 family)
MKNKASLISIGKLKQKFAKLTNNDILYVEGRKDILTGNTEENLNNIKDRLHKVMNKYDDNKDQYEQE